MIIPKGTYQINCIAYCDLTKIQTQLLQKIPMQIKPSCPTLTAAVDEDTNRSIYQLQLLWTWPESTGIRLRHRVRLDWGLPNLTPMHCDNRAANSLIWQLPQAETHILEELWWPRISPTSRRKSFLNVIRQFQERSSKDEIHTIGHVYCPCPVFSMKCKPSIGKYSCS